MSLLYLLLILQKQATGNHSPCDVSAFSIIWLFQLFNQNASPFAWRLQFGLLTTRTAEEVPKQQMMFCAKTVAKGGANTFVTLYLGSGASFYQLKTTINNPDSYGIYWCPFPTCHKKSRKKSVLRDHLNGCFTVWNAGVISCKCPR